MKISFGKRLKELREENNLTQKELAEKLGINAVTYLHYEKEQRQPSLELIADISVFYGVSVDYLLGLKDY
jgi:transcriptional regulator with XRE-family HTH domain